MALSFFIVTLSVVAVANQVNAAQFVPAPGLPPHIIAAFSALAQSSPRFPVLTPPAPTRPDLGPPCSESETKANTGGVFIPHPGFSSALAAFSKPAPPTPVASPVASEDHVRPAYAIPARRPAGLPTIRPSSLSATKAKAASLFNSESGLPPQIIAALAAIRKASRLPCLSRPTKATPAQRPVALSTTTPCPLPATKAPTLSPALSPALAPAPIIPPDLIRELVAAFTKTSAVELDSVPAPASEASSVPTAAITMPASTPKDTVPAPVSVSSLNFPLSALATHSLDPAILQNLLNSIVASPPEVCPCSFAS